MASVPLALSVHKLISSVGADAGFASVIGLAILALLYFAHARETANLREEAATLAQRLQEAEARLDAARQVAPAAAATESSPVAPEPQRRRLIPFAPAGLAAPALAAATRFIPVVAAPAQAAVAAPTAAPTPAPRPAPSPAPALAMGGAVPASSGIRVSRVAGAPAPSASPPVSAPPSSPGPTTPEPAAPVPANPEEGARPPRPTPAAPVPAQPPAQPPAPAPAAVTAFRTDPATVAGGASTRPAQEPSNGAAAAPVGVIEESGPPPSTASPVRSKQSPLGPPDRNVFVSTRTRHTPPIGRRFAVLVGLLVVVGAVAAVIIATSGTGTQNGSGASAGSNPPAASNLAFDPSLVTVAVLNGTNTNQLAHHVADRLVAQGYKEGLIATASNQTLTSTIVGYLPGTENRSAALHVAKALGLRTSTVTPADGAARAVACPPPSLCSANVIVTVGANLAAGY